MDGSIMGFAAPPEITTVPTAGKIPRIYRRTKAWPFGQQQW